jgi:hypothetical protein
MRPWRVILYEKLQKCLTLICKLQQLSLTDGLNYDILNSKTATYSGIKSCYLLFKLAKKIKQH